jgi:hypothetical protein
MLSGGGSWAAAVQDRRGCRGGSLGGLNRSTVEFVVLQASFLDGDTLSCGCFQDGLQFLECGAEVVI